MKLSLNDYPGEIASTVFTAGCNFHCPYCHNSSLTKSSSVNIDDDFFDYIYRRKHLIKAVCITGGEPTLQNDLYSFCQRCKRNSLLVKLDTNGTNPKVLQKLIENSLIDYVAMDIKAPLSEYVPFFTSNNYKEPIQESLRLLSQNIVPYELRLTVHPRLIDCARAAKIAQSLNEEAPLILQAYKHSEGVLDVSFCGEQSCPISYLEELKECMSKYLINVNIRS